MNACHGAVAAVLIGTASLSHAQIAVYSFTGNTTAATSVAANLTAGNFGGSNSPAPTNSSPVYSAGSGSYAISQDTWTGSVPGTNYFTFTLTPSAGYSLSVTSVSFGSRSTTTGPTAFSLRSSADSYAGSLLGGSLNNDSNWYSSGNQSVSLTFSSATTFRLYASGASSSGGTLRIDDFRINGTLSAVPEPSTYALIFGATALAFAIRRRGKSRKPGQRLV